MKMGIIFSAVLWGTFFILLGLSVILKHTFHVDIPVIRIFFGLFLVYLGIQVIAGGSRHPMGSSCDVVFREGKVLADAKSGEYNVIFASGLVDLTGLEVKDKDVFLKTNTIFGSSKVKLKAGVPALVKTTSAFGAARTPDGNTAAFGNSVFKTKAYQEGKPHLEVEVAVVFGDCQVILEE